MNIYEYIYDPYLSFKRGLSSAQETLKKKIIFFEKIKIYFLGNTLTLDSHPFVYFPSVLLRRSVLMPCFLNS